MSRTRMSDGTTRVVGLRSSNRRTGEAATATVYVVTAGSGDMYRIERIYLDSEQAYGFAQDYNGIAPDPGGRRLVCYQPSWKSI